MGNIRTLLVLFATLVAVSLAGQDYGVAGFEETVADRVLYGEYLDKFVKADRLLTERECKIAYFGFARQPEYAGGAVAGESRMLEAVLAGDFELAYRLGNEVLETAPVNLTALYWTLAAATETKKGWEVRNSLRARYNNVVVAIGRSGDGLSLETAMGVIYIGDIYIYCMEELGVEVGDRYVWDGRYEMLEVSPSPKFRHSAVWFDAGLPHGK